MIRMTLALLAVGAISGCSSSGNAPPTAASTSYQSNTVLAAYAGREAYPTTMPTSTDLKAAALVSQDQRTLKIYNFGSQAITDADVWVNGAYVYHVQTVASQASVTISSSDLYNAMGASLASQGTPISRVQIKMGNTLYNLWGPASL